MKLFSTFSNNRKGFTLIELLIVIALIGALAVGLIAALDPIEQINRGRDSNAQSLATEYLKAQERYFSNSGGDFAGTGYTYAANGVTLLAATDAQAGFTDLQNAGELKSQFQSQVKVANGVGARIFITEINDTTQRIRVAYQITSKAFRTNAQLTKCTVAGDSADACTPCGATGNCFVRVN